MLQTCRNFSFDHEQMPGFLSHFTVAANELEGYVTTQFLLGGLTHLANATTGNEAKILEMRHGEHVVIVRWRLIHLFPINMKSRFRNAGCVMGMVSF